MKRLAKCIIKKAKLILSEASMNLTKWKTNSNALKEVIETVTSKEVKLGFPDSSSKVLGLKYNSSKDLFTFSPETIVEASHSNEPTKKTVLQISSKLFDPIGFLSPYSIQAKILFQKLWIDGMDWDKNIPENTKTMWKNWCQNLQDLAEFEVSRWYFKNCDEIPHDVELHVFCDASQAAYGTMIYLRYVSASDIRTSFAISKGEREKSSSVEKTYCSSVRTISCCDCSSITLCCATSFSFCKDLPID
ncbi:integrase catalytic domain-containing protein [Trichonephila clavata]|uniref:Integrase catalytic domain-containing protein n=1 Tax=Trichonephila clavata TaxID=2740835 RepID=A0A8X6G744_TRICU|nr:integrase catalytic domain-containing protein [Trichonephila clavata]